MAGDRTSAYKLRLLGSRLTVPLLLLCAAVLFSWAPLTSNDTFWHIEAGRIFLKTGRVPHADSFTFTCKGNPWVNHEYLAGALFALADAAWSTRGLLLLTAAVLFLAVIILWRAALLLGPPEVNRVFPLAAFFALYAALPRIMPRPHIFSLLGASYLALLTACLLRRKWKILWTCPLCLWLWAQLHGGFLLGLAFLPLAGGYFFWKTRAYAATSALLLSPLLLFLGPYGVETLTFPFKLLGSRTFMRRIAEWQPLFSGAPWGFPLCNTVGIALVSAGLLVSAFTVRSDRVNLLVFLYLAGLSLLALKMRRALAYPVLVATVPISLWAARSLRLRKFSSTLIPALLAASAVLWGIPVGGAARRPVRDGVGLNIPEKACDFLASLGIAGKCYNSYIFGGYLTYRFFPRVLVAIDSRNLVYSEPFFQKYEESQERPTKLRARLLKQADFALFLAPSLPGSHKPILKDLREKPDWHLVYFDDTAFLYFKENLYERYNRRVPDYTALRPEDLSVDTSGKRARRLALQEARRATEICPHSLTAWVLRARAALALALSEEQSENLLLESRWAFLKAAAFRDLAMPPEAYYQLARLELLLGNVPAARGYIAKCLSGAPHFEPAESLARKLRWPR